MSKSTIILLVVLGALAFGAFVTISWGVGQYNRMVTEQESVTSQWGNVENVYQRRADLIPNLVATVKGYATHEQSTFTAVIEARAKATAININADNMTPDMLKQFQGAQDGLSSALSKLMVVVEAYPELKANQNFLDLQAQLEGTENRIAVERRKFNETAKVYNTHIRTFPANIVAGFGNFQAKPYFEAKEGSDVAPQVQF
jgi:LemA protein